MIQQQPVSTQADADGLPLVRISLFGTFDLVVNNVSVTSFCSNKTRALLAYLLMAPPQPILRTAISDLLWAGYAASSAHANLRQTIVNLRNCLAPFDLLRSSRTHLSLMQDVDLLACDVHQFEALLDACQQHEHRSLADCPVCRSRLQQAVALYQGPLLEHLPPIDSPPLSGMAC